MTESASVARASARDSSEHQEVLPLAFGLRAILTLDPENPREIRKSAPVPEKPHADPGCACQDCQKFLVAAKRKGAKE